MHILKDKHKIKQTKKGCNINIHSLQYMYKLCITLKIWIKRKCPWNTNTLLLEWGSSDQMRCFTSCSYDLNEMICAWQQDMTQLFGSSYYYDHVQFIFIYYTLPLKRKKIIINSLFELIKHLLTYWTNHF